MSDSTWLMNFSEPWQTTLIPLVGSSNKRRIACFDADATLWSEDIGEAFLRWLISGRLLKNVDYQTDIYREYQNRVADNRTAGYIWAVSLMAGLEESLVKKWCRQLADAWPNYRPQMKNLIAGLQEAGFEAWIVSASGKYIVEAAAPLMGIDVTRVLGVTSVVRDGILGDTILKPVTSEAGKVEAIKQHIGQKPDIAFGDSLGDLAMLESATVPMVVGRHDNTQADLLKLAGERDWAVHLF